MCRNCEGGKSGAVSSPTLSSHGPSVLREIFYDHCGKAKPNTAHEVLAAWENEGWARRDGSDGRGHLQALITQNIDSVEWN